MLKWGPNIHPTHSFLRFRAQTCWMAYGFLQGEKDQSSGQISSRPHTTEKPPKWWFSKGNPLISGKSRLVKYYSIWPESCKMLSSQKIKGLFGFQRPLQGRWSNLTSTAYFSAGLKETTNYSKDFAQVHPSSPRKILPANRFPFKAPKGKKNGYTPEV